MVIDYFDKYKVSKLNVLFSFLMLFLFSFFVKAQETTSEWTTWKRLGDVEDLGDRCVQLTPLKENSGGFIWFDKELDLSENFDLRVSFNFGDNFLWNGADSSYRYPEEDGGADGMAFVIQKQSTNAGSVGEGIGYQGILPSLAVEFDTYYNYNRDPLYDHIAIAVNGDPTHMTGDVKDLPYHQLDELKSDYLIGTNSRGGINHTPLLVPAKGIDTDETIQAGGLQDGEDYEARFRWFADTKIFEVWFECEKIMVLEEDIISTIFNGESSAYFGFTSATGSEVNIHKACLFSTPYTELAADTVVCIDNPVIQVDANVIDPPDQLFYEWKALEGADQSSISDPTISNPFLSPDSIYSTYSVEIITTCYPFDEPLRDTIILMQRKSESSSSEPLFNSCVKTDSIKVDFDLVLDGIFDIAWDFGDGSATDTIRLNYVDSTNLDYSFYHYFTFGANDSITAEVKLYKYDVICDEDESAVFPINIGRPIELTFDVDGPETVKGCLPLSADLEFKLSDLANAIHFKADWYFGDGDSLLNRSATEFTQNHVYLQGDSVYQGKILVTVQPFHPLYDRYCVKTKEVDFSVKIDPVLPIEFKIDLPDPVYCSLDSITTVQFDANADGAFYAKIDFGANKDTTDFEFYKNELISWSYDYTNGSNYEAKIVSYDSLCQQFDTTSLLIEIPTSNYLKLSIPDLEDVDFCSNQEIEIEGFLPSSPAISNFYWHLPENTNMFQGDLSPEIDMLTEGTHTAWFVAETVDSSYCIQKDSVSFEIEIKPFVPVTFNFTPPAEVFCSLDDSTNIVIKAFLEGTYDVKVDFGFTNQTWGTETINNGVLTVNKNYPNAGSYDLEIIYTDSICKVTDTVNHKILIPETNYLKLSIPDIKDIDFCSNQKISVEGQLPIEPVISTYYWQFPGASSRYENELNPSIGMLPSGTHKGWFIAETEDSSYCIQKDSVSFEIEVKSYVPVSFNVLQPKPVLCSLDDSTDVKIGAQIEGTYEITLIDSFGSQFWGPENVANMKWEIIESFPNGEVSTINIISKDSICGVIDTFELVIDIPKSKYLELNIDDINDVDLCSNQKLTINGTLPASPKLSNFYWHLPGTKEVFSMVENPEISLPDAGTHTAWFIAETEDPSFCVQKDSVSFEIEIKPYVPIRFEVQVPESVYCSLEDSTLISFQSSVIGAYDVSVDFDFGNTTWRSNRVRDELLNINQNFPNGGEYDVKFVFTDSICNITDSLIRKINIPASNYLKLNLPKTDDVDFCTNQQISVKGNLPIEPIISTYYWHLPLNDSLFENQIEPSIAMLPSGTHEAWFVVETKDSSYCIQKDSVAFTIEIKEYVPIDFSVKTPKSPFCAVGDSSSILVLTELTGVYDVRIDLGFGDETWDSTRLRNAGLAIDLTYPNGGSYLTNIIYTDSICSLTDTFSFPVIIPETHLLELKTPVVLDQDYCSNQEIIVSGSLPVEPIISTYYWHFPDTDSIYQNVLNPELEMLPSGTHSAWFITETTDSSYCVKKDSVSFNITIKDTVPVSFGWKLPKPLYCSTNDSTEVEFIADVNGVFDVTLFFGDDSNQLNKKRWRDEQLLIEHSYKNGEEYEVTFVYEDSICRKIDSIKQTLIIPQTHSLQIEQPTVGDVDFCMNKEISLEGKLPIAPKVERYYWNIPSLSNRYDNKLKPVIPMLSEGVHTAWFIVETADSSYCSPIDSVSFTITIKKEVPVKFELVKPDPVICSLDEETSVDLTANIIGTYFIQIDFKDSASLNIDTTIRDENLVLSHQFKNGQPYLISIISEDSICNVIDTSIIPVYIPNSNYLELNVPEQEARDFCDNQSLVFEAVLPIEPELDSFYWHFPEQTHHFVNDTLAEIKMLKPGNYKGYLVAVTSDVTYCIQKDSIEFPFSIKDEIPASFEMNDPDPINCSSGDSTEIGLSVAVIGNYSIKIDWGSKIDSSILRTEAWTKNYELKNDSIYPVEIILIDSVCQKVDTFSHVFEIPESKFLEFNLPEQDSIAACSTDWELEVTANLGSQNISTYYWGDGEGNYFGENEQTTTVDWLEKGSNLIWFFAETNDSSYCVNKDSVAMKVQAVHHPTFRPELSLPQLDLCTEGANLEELIISGNFEGGSIPDSVYWDFGDGKVYTSSGETAMTHQYADFGVYHLKANMIDPNGCRDSLFEQEIVLQNPLSLIKTAFAKDYIHGCSPFTISYQADTIQGVQSSYWTFEDGTTETSLNVEHVVEQTGIYKAWFVAVSDEEGYCLKRDSLEIEIELEKPAEIDVLVDFDPPAPCTPETIEEYQVQLSINSDRPIGGVVWDFGNDSIIQTMDGIVDFTYQTLGDYVIGITILDTLCDKKIELSEYIKVERGARIEKMIIPNVITPNGDYLNDEFDIVFETEVGVPNPEKYIYYTIDVYNRWGDLVFKSYKDENGKLLWDGTSIDNSGEMLNPGIYFYHLEVEANCIDEIQRETKRGHVTLLK